MVCFYVGRDQKIFVSPENYGDWRSARSRSTSFAGRLGRNQKIFYFLALKPLTHNITFAPLVHSRSRLNYRTRSREPSDSPFDSPRLRSTH